jgi:hypothetical protein
MHDSGLTMDTLIQDSNSFFSPLRLKGFLSNLRSQKSKNQEPSTPGARDVQASFFTIGLAR